MLDRPVVKILHFSVISLENKVGKLDAKLNEQYNDLEADFLRNFSISEITPVEEHVKAMQIAEINTMHYMPIAQVQKQDWSSELITNS